MKPNPEKYYDKLVLRKLMGITSPEEDADFELWLKLDPQNRESYEAFKSTWLNNMEDAPAFEGMPRRKRGRTSVRQEDGPVFHPVKKRPIAFYVFEGLALALLVVASVLIFMGLKERPTVYHAGRTIRTVLLPDSSRVTLKSGGTLLVSSQYGKLNRSVEVEGKAFIEVRPDSITPFLLVSDHSRIEVTGTSLMVDIEKDSGRQEVTVLTGHVRMSSLKNSEKEVLITAGKRGEFDYRAGALTLSEADTANVLAWKERRLVFDQTPMAEVVRVVEDYFGIQVQVENREILKCTFTHNFSEPTVDDVIKSLREKMDVIVMREYGRIVVDGRNTCPERK